MNAVAVLRLIVLGEGAGTALVLLVVLGASSLHFELQQLYQSVIKS